MLGGQAMLLHALQGYAAHECSEGAAQALSPRPALLRQRGRNAHPDAFLHLLLCPSEVKRPGHSPCPLHPAITTTPRPTPGAASCNHVQKLSPVKDALDCLPVTCAHYRTSACAACVLVLVCISHLLFMCLLPGMRRGRQPWLVAVQIYLRIKERLSLQAATWQRMVSGAKDMFSRPRLIGGP